VALQPGMTISNEPGLYLRGEYGIRIENVCLITEAFSVEQSLTGHGPFYQLTDLTLVPYEKNLIDKDNLSAQEIKWINDYHAQIDETLSPDLPKEVAAWLHQKTSPL
jgi:Xaa-Pro aminopeptidase